MNRRIRNSNKFHLFNTFLSKILGRNLKYMWGNVKGVVIYGNY